MSSRRPFRQVAEGFVGLLEDPPPDISLALLQRALLELYFAALSWFRFRIHWGAHAADALRALHWKLIGMNG
jgi:hypothetical protein